MVIPRQKFTLSTITIGPLTQTVSSAALTGLKITPGIMYNLKFTLSPADVYLDNYNGQKAARINGKVWMRYNLGADTVLIQIRIQLFQVFMEDIIRFRARCFCSKWNRNIFKF